MLGYLDRWGLTNFPIYSVVTLLDFFLAYFNIFLIMSVCLHVYLHYMCIWCTQKTEEGADPLKLELEMVVRG